MDLSLRPENTAESSRFAWKAFTCEVKMRIARFSLGKLRDLGFVAFLVVTPSLSHPAAGQGQLNTAQGSAATTAFDGKYVGTAALAYGEAAYCREIESADMTIAGGQVLIHADNPDGVTAPKLTFQGNVNAAGVVSASTPSGPLIGTIRGKDSLLYHSNSVTAGIFKLASDPE
jgi:hypothetical protein